MPPHDALFLLSPATEPADVLTCLAERFRLDVHPPAPCTRRYLDSFDWRLYAAETTLFLETCGGRRRLRWHSRTTGAVLQRRPARSTPRTPDDVPAGPFREGLAALLGVRVLLPLVVVRFDRTEIDVHDANEKTIARLRVESLQSVAAPDGPRRTADATYVRLQPIRGYDKTWGHLYDALADMSGVAVAPEALFERALEHIGRRPDDTTSKFAVTLDPDERADTAVKIVLDMLLQIMTRNEPGMREDLDPEFLHDYRVALRRTRTVLGQFKDVFVLDEAVRFQEALRTLFRATGPLRDLHVYVTDFDVYRAWLPPGPQTDLEPLRAFLARRAARRHEELVVLLDDPAYGDLMACWRAFVDAPAPEEPPSPEAALPIRVLAARRTWRAFTRVLKQGKAIRRIGPDAPAEQLHRLRISCKKLRYLMELFRSLYPPENVDRLIDTLKLLQDNLGAIQDYRVQQDNLHRFALEMNGDPAVDIRTFLAMGRLEAHLERLQREARARFDETFRAFARPKNRRRFAELFRDG